MDVEDRDSRSNRTSSGGRYQRTGQPVSRSTSARPLSASTRPSRTTRTCRSPGSTVMRWPVVTASAPVVRTPDSTPRGSLRPGRTLTPMNICVFLSAADLDDRYTRPAREFARLLGKGGHTLVWGGSDSGLMKVVADGVQEAGGRLCGVSVDFLAAKARHNADEMVIANDLAERKPLLLEKADAIVIMVGGTGTLDEATEILELKKHGHTGKPVVLLNTAGFYNELNEQFQRMEDEGFLPLPLPT
ncbi:hypothetical protein SCALM49S_06640 [Streptomyces californicus]